MQAMVYHMTIVVTMMRRVIVYLRGCNSHVILLGMNSCGKRRYVSDYCGDDKEPCDW